MHYIKNSLEAQQIAQQLAHEQWLGLDIETAPTEKHKHLKSAALSPHTARIRLVQIATPDGRAFVFDLNYLNIKILQPLFNAPQIAFNAAFEHKFLTNAGITFNARLHDAMLMDRVINHKLRKLDVAAEDLLNMHLNKIYQCSDWGQSELSEQQLIYAADDALAPLQIGQQLLPIIKERGQIPIYKLWMDSLPVLSELNLRGQLFDWEQHSKLHEQWQAEKLQLDAELLKLLGDINPRSGTQLGAWLIANLESEIIKKWPRTPKEKLKTDAATFGLFADLPMIAPLLKIKKINKLISTYGAGYIRHKNEVTQRLHTEFRLGNSKTGRLTASNPNTQNPPRDSAFRSLFIADENRVLIGADYSQIELRIAALLSNDTNMLNAYYKDEDLHKKTAQFITGCNEITPEQRQGAKPVNFGSLFCQMSKGLARNAKLTYGVNMTVREASKALKAFDEAYPDLSNWKSQQIAEAMAYRRVTTPLGLVRDFSTSPAGYEAGEAVNCPIQGAGAEVLLSSIKRLPELNNLNARLEHNVHDELLLSAPKENSVETAHELNRIMCEGFIDIFPQAESMLSNLVEVKTGLTWDKVH